MNKNKGKAVITSFLTTAFILGSAAVASGASILVSPTMTPEKNYMVGSNVTFTASAQNAANIPDFKAVQRRLLYYFYSTKSTCSSDPGFLVGNLANYDITASGLNATSKTFTISNDNVGYYICIMDVLTVSKTTTNVWSVLYSDRVGAQVNAAVANWSGLIPKIVIIPPLVAVQSSTPTPSPSASASAAEIPAPTGYKATFVEEPTVESKIQATVKAWDLKGNTFKSRSLKVRLCTDDKCEKVVTTFDVVESAALEATTSKTFTMAAPIGPVDNYVQIIDALTYTNANLGADKTTRTYSLIKKLTSSTPSASPSESIAQATESATPVAEPENTASTNNLSGIVIGVLGTLLVLALVAIVFILKRKKQDSQTNNVNS